MAVQRSSIMDWMVKQSGPILRHRTRAWRNPRPAGSMLKGSGTERVLAFLRAHPAQWFLRCEVRDALLMSDGRTGWALRRLTVLGLVEEKWVWHVRRRAVLGYRFRSPGAARGKARAAPPGKDLVDSLWML